MSKFNQDSESSEYSGLSSDEDQTSESEQTSDSEEENVENTVGNVPLERYENYDHIGYDLDGRKIAKSKDDDEVDDFIKKFDDPAYWKTVRHQLSGRNMVLNDDELNLVRRITTGKFPDPQYNPYHEFIDFFTYEPMIHPVTNRPETKASFIPSLSEKRAISRLVAKIKRAKNLPKVKKETADDRFTFTYDLWSTEDPPSRRTLRYIPAPKMKLPGHEESYNPPPEYLLTPQEEEQWKNEEPERRKLDFIPQKHGRLRQVPAYPEFVKERFERCLDLYLCPRTRKQRANVNPEDLIPKLPKPKELLPFPTMEALQYIGHTSAVNCITVEPAGQFFISGGNDCCVKVWEILTGRCMKTLVLSEPVQDISWCPDYHKSLCIIASGKNVLIFNPSIGDKEVVENTDSIFDDDKDRVKETDASCAEWTSGADMEEMTDGHSKGVRMVLKHKHEVKQVTWHHKGDYFAVVMPNGGNESVVIHQLSRRRSQIPFQKSKGLIQCVAFHPSRPFFFVATQRYIRIYNLVKQELTKKLLANCKQISSFAIHPKGDNLIIGSYDLRLSWFDLDLSEKPYRTLKYHKKAIRKVAYHKKYPLFASASDDGSVIVSHGMVYNDLLQNALIVPVKRLRGYQTKENVAVLDCTFHPTQPWILTAGVDSVIRLFT